MITNKILIAGIAGGIITFMLGGIFYGVLLMDFMAANTGSATGVMKEPMDMWALILGNLIYGFFIAIIFGWSKIMTWSDGMKSGAVVGLLLAGFFDLTMYGTTNVYNLSALAADVGVMTVMTAITGSAVGYILGSGKEAAAA